MRICNRGKIGERGGRLVRLVGERLEIRSNFAKRPLTILFG